MDLKFQLCLLVLVLGTMYAQSASLFPEEEMLEVTPQKRSLPDYPEIVPKGSSKARGIDFCGTHDYYYIIRSDQGVYMKSSNFNGGSDLQVFTLSQPCRWGDHYLATVGAFLDLTFYIIKGNEYRRVSNMNSDEDAVVFSLHPNCRGGSHYYSAFGLFYIVFADRKVYRRVTDMSTDAHAVEYRLHEAFQDGIYFWGVIDYVYALKQPNKWGVVYHRSTNMHKNTDGQDFNVHPDVVNFLPGGLAQTQGKAFGYWEKLKSWKNDANVAVDWEKSVKETIGFKKSEMSSIEHNWSIKLGATYSAGDLTAAFAKYQFSLTVQYGGSSVNTEQQEWSEVTEKTEKIKLHIPAGGEVYIWQYQMGFGTKKNLFCVYNQLTDDSNPPPAPASVG